jgi:hypothetical protein
MWFTKHQCKYSYIWYHIVKYAEYQNFSFHPTKHAFPFKVLFVPKFSKYHHFEDITNIYWYLDEHSVSVFSQYVFLRYFKILPSKHHQTPVSIYKSTYSYIIEISNFHLQHWDSLIIFCNFPFFLISSILTFSVIYSSHPFNLMGCKTCLLVPPCLQYTVVCTVLY